MKTFMSTNSTLIANYKIIFGILNLFSKNNLFLCFGLISQDLLHLELLQFYFDKIMENSLIFDEITIVLSESLADKNSKILQSSYG